LIIITTGSGQSTHVGDANYCINIRDENVPTEISVAQPDSYNLISFSTHCSAIDHQVVRTQTIRKPRVVNQRKPICSFKLLQPVQNSVTVTFFGSTTNAYVVNNEGCVNVDICSNSDQAFQRSAYALSVNVQANGVQANNQIQLFSENECEQEVGIVSDGVNLVSITRENEPVKSIMIKESS